MRYPVGHKQESRERILSAAADLFRGRGMGATGVDAVMAAAGLTPGGFYAHFRSKDELVAAAVRTAGEKAYLRWVAPLEGLRGRAWSRAFVRRYLSPEHRDDVESGCSLPSLAADVARSNVPVRRQLEARLRGLFELVRERTGPELGLEREQILGSVALCVGGLLLARVVVDANLSSEILAASQAGSEQLLAPRRVSTPRRRKVRR